MKTKIIALVAVLMGLSFNVASGEDLPVNGNIGTKFASDYARRGQLVSEEAIQAQVGFNVGFAGVDVFGDFFTNQSTDSAGADNEELTLGVGASLLNDNINAYLGVYNTDNSANGDTLEAFASIGVDSLLSPTVSVYRDTDESLYTFEGQLSHEFDFESFGLEMAGILGNTDITSSADETYLGAKLTANKTIKDNVNLYADIALSDTDTRTKETLWGVGLSVRF